MTRVSPILNDLYHLAKKLRQIKKKYRYIRYRNIENKKQAEEDDEEIVRIQKYKKKPGCRGKFQRRDIFDAEDYYKNKIEYKT